MKFKDYTSVSFTCIKADVDTVHDCLYKILTKKGDTWTISYQNLDISTIYFPMAQKGSGYKRKFVLWEPVSYPNTTIFMANLLDGWESLMHILNYKFKIELSKIHLSNEKDEEPMFCFHYQAGDYKRIVRSMIDGKWKFYEAGELLTFENLEYYKKRKIKDRVNYIVIHEYLKKMRWDIEDDNFYHPVEGIARYFEEDT